MTDEELALVIIGRQAFALEKLRRENAELRKRVDSLISAKTVEAPGL